MKTIYENENLDYSNFSNKCLIGVTFVNCNIRHCSFEGCDLSYAFFESCDLYCSKFDTSVLYYTRFLSCDATKAIFEKSLLNGIRIHDTTITFAKLGFDLTTGKERKSHKLDSVTDKYFTCCVGDNIPAIKKIEYNYDGIFCIDTKTAIRFIDTDDSEWKVFKRKSEVAKSIKKLLEDNGYGDLALDYYFLFRRFLRKSRKNGVTRLTDYIFGELFWGYGVKILHPIIAFFANSIFFSIVYSVLPFFSQSSGMKMSDNILIIFSKSSGFHFLEYLKILYGSVLISALSAFGDIDIVGYGRIFALFHVLISVLSIGLGLTALSKKMSNV